MLIGPAVVSVITYFSGNINFKFMEVLIVEGINVVFFITDSFTFGLHFW